MMAMKYVTFSRFGNLNAARLDFLIFLPHVSEDLNFMHHVRKTANISLNHISDAVLQDFLLHEADTGVR
jgi:hypothetical protein